jgi:putative ABC transport system substrate-binding protein
MNGHGWRDSGDSMMGRREIVLLLGASLLAPPIVAQSQPVTRIWRIGFLDASAASVNRHFLEARRGLRELGYVEGDKLVIDARRAEGRAERFPELLGELLRLKPDVIVVAGNRCCCPPTR